MQHIFYFFAIAAIMYEVAVIISPKKIGAKLKSYRAATKDTMTSNHKAFSYMQFLYFVWMFVGLVSTTSSTPETFTMVVKTSKDEIYQIPVDIKQYYLTNTEKPVKFEVTTGGLSGDQLNIELI